jgi:hypothetical protein
MWIKYRKECLNLESLEAVGFHHLAQEKEAQTLVCRVLPLEEAEAQMLDSYNPGNLEMDQLVYHLLRQEKEEAQNHLYLAQVKIRAEMYLFHLVKIRVKMVMLRQELHLIRISQMVPGHLIK